MTALIEPALSGEALAVEIARAEVGPGEWACWWLGQSGFVLKSRAGTLVIDPYLSEHLTRKYQGTAKPHVRMTRCPISPGHLEGIDAVLCSHKHSDHLDPGTAPALLEANPRARLALPRSLLDHAESLGLPRDRLIGLEAGDTREIGGWSIRAIPSAHEGLDTDENGWHLYLGFVIASEEIRGYHSGDSMLYEGLEGQLGPDPFDVFFLPINGRDPARGVAGNMSAADAVALAGRVRPRLLIPHHYDMFTFNTVPVGAFVEASEALPEGVAASVLRCGEQFRISSRA